MDAAIIGRYDVADGFIKEIRILKDLQMKMLMRNAIAFPKGKDTEVSRRI